MILQINLSNTTKATRLENKLTSAVSSTIRIRASNVFVLAVSAIERALLDRHEPKRKSRAKFLQSSLNHRVDRRRLDLLFFIAPAPALTVTFTVAVAIAIVVSALSLFTTLAAILDGIFDVVRHRLCRQVSGVREPSPLLLLENVTMMTKKDVIALIVKGDDAPSLEVWSLRKHRRKHSRDAVTQTRVEIVQNQLWIVTRRLTMTFNLFGKHEGRQLVQTRRSLWQVNV